MVAVAGFLFLTANDANISLTRGRCGGGFLFSTANDANGANISLTRGFPFLEMDPFLSRRAVIRVIRAFRG